MSLTTSSMSEAKHTVQQSNSNLRESAQDSLFSSLNFRPTALRNPRPTEQGKQSQERRDSVPQADLNGELKKFRRISSQEKRSSSAKITEETRDNENTQSCS